jgi:putative ABC transport system permease protein
MSTRVTPKVWGGDKFTAEGMSYRTFLLNFTSVDENYIPTLKIQLLFGRNFSKEMPGDESRVFLNETTVEQIGWTLDESVVRKKFNYPALICSLK